MRHPTAPIEAAPHRELLVASEGDRSATPKNSLRARADPTGLIVDDEPGILRISRRVLKQIDFRILDGSDGASALQVVETHPGPIHLLITDLVIPEMSGQELIERVRLVRPEMKVLCVSGSAEGSSLRRVSEIRRSPSFQSHFLPEPSKPRSRC